MKNNGLNVLVVGAGMYVCGRGTDGYGTILPALYQAKKAGLIGEVAIAATSPQSVNILQKKLLELDKVFNFRLKPLCCPVGGKEDLLAYQQVLASGFVADCAIVSVPDDLHVAVTSFLLGNKLHCLVVKPLAPDIVGAKKLIALQQKHNVYGAVEFHKRYDRSNLKLRDVVSQGVIGDPLYFAVEYSQRKTVPMKIFKPWVERTNIFQYLGIHYVDIINFATQALPLRTMSLGQKGFLSRLGIKAYDAIQNITEWQLPNDRRFTSVILTNWIDPEKSSSMSDQKIKVIGTKGRFEADQKKRGLYLLTDAKGVEEPNPDFSAFYGRPGSEELSFQGYGVESIHQFLKDVSAIKEGNNKPSDYEGWRPTFIDSLIPTAVIEAANASLRRAGEWIKIKL